MTLRWLWRACPCSRCRAQREHRAHVRSRRLRDAERELAKLRAELLAQAAKERRELTETGRAIEADRLHFVEIEAAGPIAKGEPVTATGEGRVRTLGRRATGLEVVLGYAEAAATRPGQRIRVQVAGRAPPQVSHHHAVDVPPLCNRLEIGAETLFRIRGGPGAVAAVLAERLRHAGFDLSPGAPPIEGREDWLSNVIVYEQRKRAQRVAIRADVDRGYARHSEIS